MTANFSGAYNYTHLAANGTTTIKSTAGVLSSLVVNTRGASGNTITLYDNTSASGAVIAVIDTTGFTFTGLYDVQFNTGLTVVIAGGTAGDVTIAWL